LNKKRREIRPVVKCANISSLAYNGNRSAVPGARSHWLPHEYHHHHL